MYKNLLEYLVKNLVTNPDKVVVSEEEKDSKIILHLTVDSADMGRIIGKQACVPTTPEDKIVLARRPGQPHPSRIVCYKNPIPTTKLTLDLSISTTGKNMDGLLTVDTAYYGDKIPKELNDPELSDQEKIEAEAYWKNHALCSLAIFGKHQPPREAIFPKEPNMPSVRTNRTEDELCL